jgi:mono/diheme cytochrome c family protein
MKLKSVKLVIGAAFSVLLVMALSVPTALPASSPVAFDGAATYKGKCAACHGLDGSGNTAFGKKENIRDLRSAEVQGMSDEQLFDVIAKGKKKMPGYEKTLGADTCKELVSYVRQLKQ